MNREPLNFGKLAVQSLIAIVIHLAMVGVAFGITWYMTSDTTAVAAEFAAQVNGQADAQASLQAALEDGRAMLALWLFRSFGASAALTILFLVATISLRPQLEEHARSQKPLWAFLFIAVIILTLLIWWLGIWQGEIGLLLVSAAYTVTTVIGFVLVWLTFYLATATCVKSTMQPSVPASAFLPSLGS